MSRLITREDPMIVKLVGMVREIDPELDESTATDLVMANHVEAAQRAMKLRGFFDMGPTGRRAAQAQALIEMRGAR